MQPDDLVHTIRSGQVLFATPEEQNLHAIGKCRMAYDAGINHPHVAHPICARKCQSLHQLQAACLSSAVSGALSVGGRGAMHVAKVPVIDSPFMVGLGTLHSVTSA